MIASPWRCDGKARPQRGVPPKRCFAPHGTQVATSRIQRRNFIPTQERILFDRKRTTTEENAPPQTAHWKPEMRNGALEGRADGYNTTQNCHSGSQHQCCRRWCCELFTSPEKPSLSGAARYRAAGRSAGELGPETLHRHRCFQRSRSRSQLIRLDCCSSGNRCHRLRSWGKPYRRARSTGRGNARTGRSRAWPVDVRASRRGVRDP